MKHANRSRPSCKRFVQTKLGSANIVMYILAPDTCRREANGAASMRQGGGFRFKDEAKRQDRTPTSFQIPGANQRQVNQPQAGFTTSFHDLLRGLKDANNSRESPRKSTVWGSSSTKSSSPSQLIRATRFWCGVPSLYCAHQKPMMVLKVHQVKCRKYSAPPVIAARLS